MEKKKSIKAVAVDCGKNMTKAVTRLPNGEIKKFSVLTKEAYTSETTSTDGYVVTVNDEKMLIGSTGGEFNFDTSKALTLHRHATYLAISQLINNGDEIVLAIGCPLSVWFNKQAREDYMRFMLNIPLNDNRNPSQVESNIQIIVNENPFEFTIKTILALPETSGFLLKTDDYEDSDVAIVDIGGLNINGVLYQNGYPNENTFFTINEGGNRFKVELADELNRVFVDANIDTISIDKVLRDGYIRINKEESAKIIQSFKENFFNKIKSQMKARKWSTATWDFVFVGGGSLLFADYIKNDPQFADAVISNNPVWDNAEGFLEAAEDVAENFVIEKVK